MKQLRLEAETIQVSIYSNVISEILRKHKQISITKLVVFSYIVKKENDLYGRVYNANNTQDIIHKSLSLLSGDFVEYCDSIEFIIKAISILENIEFLKVENEQIEIINQTVQEVSIYQVSLFVQKAIEDSKRISDKQFMKEVINNV